MCHDWPKPPIWPEDLPLSRELLTDEEYAELLKRMVQVVPHGPRPPGRHLGADEEVAQRRDPRASWQERGIQYQ